MLQAALSLFAINILHVIAAENQGILLPDRRLPTAGISAQMQAGITLSKAAQSCAEQAANAGFVKFEIQRGGKYNSNTGRFEGNLAATYQCIHGHPPASNISGSVSDQILDIRHLSYCNDDCTKADDFQDVALNTEFDETDRDYMNPENLILLADRTDVLPFRECKKLALYRNSALQARYGKADPTTWHEFTEGVPRTMGVYYYTAAETGNTSQRTYCYGLSEFALAGPFAVSETWVGLLTPARFVKHLPAADSYAFDALANVACTQKDIPYKFYDKCQQFTYEFDGVTTPNNRLPATFEVADNTRVIKQAHLKQRTTFRYDKIGQTANNIIPVNFPAVIPIQTNTLSAFSPQEAVEACAVMTAKKSHRAFNLYLTEKGWYCRQVFVSTTSIEVLSEENREVLQSYLFSQNASADAAVAMVDIGGDSASSGIAKRQKSGL